MTNKDQLDTNKVKVAGTIINLPVYSHEVMGEKFYECYLQSNRLSGKDDILPITLSDRIGLQVNIGDRVYVEGQLRSYNKFDEELGKSKLILTVFARNIRQLEPNEEDKNEVYLCGFLCKPPIYRTTPFNREICDMLLACNRAYKKSDYIPLIAWGRNARLANDQVVGDQIEIVGRLQSREYIKQTDCGSEQKTAYEVSVSSLNVNESIKN